MTAELLEVRVQLEHQTQLTHTTKTERDAAIATLHKHGVSCDHLGDHVTDIRTLQAQNEKLRGIIKQMRVELEQLSDWSDRCDGESVPTANYVRYMEEEVRKVKTENRKLSEKVQQTAAQRKPPTPNNAKTDSHSPIHDDRKLLSSGHDESPVPQETRRNSSPSGVRSQHRTHLIALSDTIASLQREKGEVENQAQQWQGKVKELQDRLKEEQEMVSGTRTRCVTSCIFGSGGVWGVVVHTAGQLRMRMSVLGRPAI